MRREALFSKKLMGINEVSLLACRCYFKQACFIAQLGVKSKLIQASRISQSPPESGNMMGHMHHLRRRWAGVPCSCGEFAAWAVSVALVLQVCRHPRNRSSPTGSYPESLPPQQACFQSHRHMVNVSRKMPAGPMLLNLTDHSMIVELKHIETLRNPESVQLFCKRSLSKFQSLTLLQTTRNGPQTLPSLFFRRCFSLVSLLRFRLPRLTRLTRLTSLLLPPSAQQTATAGLCLRRIHWVRVWMCTFQVNRAAGFSPGPSILSDFIWGLTLDDLGWPWNPCSNGIWIDTNLLNNKKMNARKILAPCVMPI